MDLPIQEDVARAYIDGRNDGRAEASRRIRRELLGAVATWRNNVGLHDGRTVPLTEREYGANAACAAILSSLDKIVPEEG